MNKVTNYREVKYDLDTKIEALHWDDFIVEAKCTEFFDDGDYYAVYENLDEPDDHERKKYAIYQHNTGKLICLMADSGLVLDLCYDDEDYRLERDELYKQIAMLAGWPEKIEPKQRYTVRIQRVMDVEVRANDKGQARLLGEKLARYINSGDYLCNGGNGTDKAIDCALAGCENELEDVWDALSEDEGVWDLALSVEECERLLELED